MSGSWDLGRIGDQSGRTFVVTGPSPGGLGAVVALELARAGGRVVLAGRNRTKLDQTATAITRAVHGAELEQLEVNLADLASVRQAAARAARFGSIDVLINNAGVMAVPYARTPDNLELQLATNHFGPFLLTGLLLPQLSTGTEPRVVTVSSRMHRYAKAAPLADPHDEGARYLGWPTYAATKLANLLFTFELDRRLTRAELPIKALAAHPGFTGTQLMAGARQGRPLPIASILAAANRALAMPPSQGALPILMAATDDLPGGTFCGPSGPGELMGPPGIVRPSAKAQDETAQAALWGLSEDVVRLTWP